MHVLCQKNIVLNGGPLHEPKRNFRRGTARAAARVRAEAPPENARAHFTVIQSCIALKNFGRISGFLD
jgi:hypothetical protein